MHKNFHIKVNWCANLSTYGELGLDWLEGWKSGRIENCERIENILNFLIFVWLGVEKWNDGKNVFINLLIYPY